MDLARATLFLETRFELFANEGDVGTRLAPQWSMFPRASDVRLPTKGISMQYPVHGVGCRYAERQAAPRPPGMESYQRGRERPFLGRFQELTCWAQDSVAPA